MSVEYDQTTILVWRHEDMDRRKRSLTVTHDPHGDMKIVYAYDTGCEDQVLDLDEHAWHALCTMLGEVR